MKLEKLVVGELQENCYILSNNKNECIIIDPGDEFTNILNFVEKYDVKGILITHGHFDHVGALKELKDCYNIKENDFDSLNEFRFHVIKTPGHTHDSLSFYFPIMNSLFVGDFVFKQGIGRTDIGGNMEDMKDSIKFLLENFNDNLILYPGHGEKTTLKEEKIFLEYLLSL